MLNLQIINSPNGIQKSLAALRELGIEPATDDTPIPPPLTPKQRAANQTTAEQLRDYWRQHDVPLKLAAARMARREHGILRAAYNCIITPFGPQGYYQTPDTIFVNSVAGHPDSPFITLLHELTHLILYAKTSAQDNAAAEHTIDTAVAKYFLPLLRQ